MMVMRGRSTGSPIIRPGIPMPPRPCWICWTRSAPTLLSRPASSSTSRPASSNGPVGAAAPAVATKVAGTTAIRRTNTIAFIAVSYRPRATRSVVDDQGRHRIALQLRASVEEGQLDEEGQPDHDAAALFAEPEGRPHRAPRGGQIAPD